MAERMRLITVTNNFDIYFTPEDLKMDNNVRTWHEGRYIDSCYHGIITSEDWQFLLPDSIHYLRTDCKVTQYDELKIELIDYTNIDITTSPNWQYEQWLKSIKESCKELC